MSSFYPGIQTLQRLTGCELLGDDKEGRMVVMEAFDGESGDVLYYNKHEGSFLTDVKWTFMHSTTYSVYVKYLLKEIFHPLCMEVLRKYLKKEKNRMAKKGKLYVFCAFTLLQIWKKEPCHYISINPRIIKLILGINKSVYIVENKLGHSNSEHLIKCSNIIW